MYSDGDTMEAIAEQLGCGIATVHRAITRTGMVRRPTSTPIYGDKHRKCCTCKVVLPVDSFARNRRLPLGRSYTCRVCSVGINMRRYHGIDQAEYDVMLAAQDGRCAICGATESKHPVPRLVIDHCHASMKIRGLLCSNCNRALGLLGDDVAVLRAAIAYLELATSKFASESGPA